MKAFNEELTQEEVIRSVGDLTEAREEVKYLDR